MATRRYNIVIACLPGIRDLDNLGVVDRASSARPTWHASVPGHLAGPGKNRAPRHRHSWAALNLDLGQMLKIINPPPWFGYDAR